MKKIVAYMLISIVMVLALLAILGIWGIIDLKNIMMNTIFSFIVIFAASAVILFIHTVFMKEDQKPF